MKKARRNPSTMTSSACSACHGGGWRATKSRSKTCLTTSAASSTCSGKERSSSSKKSAGRELKRAKQQALDCFLGLKDSELPRYILASDFQTFELHDLESDKEPVRFTLMQLPEKVQAFAFMFDGEYPDSTCQKQRQPTGLYFVIFCMCRLLMRINAPAPRRNPRPRAAPTSSHCRGRSPARRARCRRSDARGRSCLRSPCGAPSASGHR
jgi:hypothetical protein